MEEELFGAARCDAMRCDAIRSYQSKRAGEINKQQRARGSSEEAPGGRIGCDEGNCARRRSRSEIVARGGAKGSRFGDGYDLKNARIILLHTTVSFPNPVMLQVPRCPLFTRRWSRISERSPSCGFSVAAHAGTCRGPSKDLCHRREAVRDGM